MGRQVDDSTGHWSPGDTRPTGSDGHAGMVIPLPGRHLGRRPWPLRVDSLRFTPAHLAVVAVVVAVALAGTAWWVLGGESEPVPARPAAPLVATASSRPSSGSEAPSPSTTTAARIVVDVSGKVRDPGIVVLHPGARVVDAIRSAGGARPGADLSSVNLARPLIDGEQILVGVPPAEGTAAGSLSPGPTPSGTTGTTGTLVDLNTADQAALEGLPEVGPVTAQAIIAWRDQNGGFTAVDQLLEVDGIGEVTLSQIAPFVTV